MTTLDDPGTMSFERPGAPSRSGSGRFVAGLARVAVPVLCMLGAASCGSDAKDARPPGAGPTSAASATPGPRPAVAGKRLGPVTEYPVAGPNAAMMIPAVGPDHRLWVAAMNLSALIVLDPQTMTIDEIKVASGTQGTSTGHPSIVADPRYTWECVATSELGLMGVAVDPATGFVWFAEQAVDSIGVYEPATGAIRDFALPTKGSAPNAVAVDGAGRVWATALATSQLVVLDPATAAVTEFDLPGDDAFPYALAIASDQKVWFTLFNRDAIGSYDPVTGAFTEYAVAGSRGTTAVAVDPAGHPWFTTADGRLVRLDPETGGMLSLPVPMDGRVYGVSIDVHGHVWVGGLAARLAAYDPSADSWRVVEMPTAGTSAWWPAASPDGGVWTVQTGANNIVRIET